MKFATVILFQYYRIIKYHRKPLFSMKKDYIIQNVTRNDSVLQKLTDIDKK
jgi:hypothetical protein